MTHSRDELSAFPTVFDQLALRRDVIAGTLAAAQIEISSLAAIVGRGGLIRPVASGTYPVTPAMLDDLQVARYGEHASNLGPALAHALGAPHGIPAYTVDPVVTDELSPASRLVGLAGYERRAVWHALSQKAVAKRFADDTLCDYDTLNLVVAHIGGGVTVGCHAEGRCFYVNDGLNEGPMTAERAGAVPHCVLFDLMYGQELDQRQARRRLVGEGGLYSHLGTTDLRVVETRIDAGDEKAALVFEALLQGIAGTIAASVPRFGGAEIDGILLTGGMTRSARLVARLRTLLSPLRISICVFPGELENEALRDGALRVLNGHEELLTY